MNKLNIQVVFIPINDLKSSEYNPRRWNQQETSHLKESIERFGMVDPILVNKAKNRVNIVIGGHFRLHIAKELGYKVVPVVYLNIPDLKKEKELNLRLNKNIGEWDWDLLKEYAIDDLLKIGFDEVDLSKFWDNELSVEENNFNVEKSLEEVQKKPISHVGDMFQLGNHRVICGDATDLKVVQRLVDQSPIGYINCDPPYNIKLNYSKGIGNKGNYGGQEKDNRSFKEYKEFLRISIENALAVSQKNTHIFYWCDETYVGLLQDLYKSLSVDNKRLCIWIKNNQNATPQIAFNKMIECCVYGIRGKPYINETIRNLNEIQNKEIGSGNRSADDIYDLLSIWLVDRLPASEYKHPTMKSPTLYEKALRRCTRVDDFVLDLFGGSGSQLIACEQLKRRALLVEIDPVFVDLILYRYEQLTGIKPVKLS